jgi:hypothetical protein
MKTSSLHLNLKPLLALIALVAFTVCCDFVSTSRAATRVQLATCPSLGAHLAPNEARKEAESVVSISNSNPYPISPTLTHYAMGLASQQAAATPTKPPVTLKATISEPSPTLMTANQAARACGYTGTVRATAISSPVSTLHDAAAFDVEVAVKKMQGSTAIGVGVAFDRFGDMHIVYVSGTINDNDGSDPFASYTENKPAHPLPHPTGFLVLLSVGPYCAKHVCSYDHPRGGVITVYRGTRRVGRGITNSKGLAEIILPGPGRYTIESSFVDRGRRYHSKGSGFPAMAGVMMPVTLTACAPGDFC